jgi:Fur family transcriptional regulator, ferric uptake regulator
MGKSVVETGTAEQLRAAGIKVTSARVRVFDALAAAHQPLCHAELDTRLAATGEAALDRVTLYRVLDALVACGLAAKSMDNRGVFRFATVAARQQHAGHAHFRCTDCGSVFCLDTVPPPAPKLPRGFQLVEVELDVSGTCVNCARHGSDR